MQATNNSQQQLNFFSASHATFPPKKSKQIMKKFILVTGFGPFAGHPTNASWESVQLLPQLWKNEEIELNIDQIPVCYDFVQQQFPGKYTKSTSPIFYVHVGVSSEATNVVLETKAHNSGYVLPDVFGKCPKNNW
jgi:pyroglutamyl-peptidase